MSTIQIPNLGAVVGIDGTELMEVVQTGTSKRVSLSQISAYVLTNLGSFPLSVSLGGTGNNNFTANGLLYGNGTSAINATSAGSSGQVLVGSAGSAPSFSSTPTISTSVTVPTVLGGTTASSTLTLQSTSGSGTSDQILMKVGSSGAVVPVVIDTTGAQFFRKIANAVNVTATLTVAQLQGGIITSTTAAPVTMTMPTGTVLDTAGTGISSVVLPTNATIEFTIKNTGATNAITLSMASGVTNGGAAGDLTIALNTTETYWLTKTGSATFVIYKK